ncbi:putative calcium-transporting ATPase 13, plasma membrane-type [Rhododendron vialii]|uniref:putative calcium-transporting ATPase 13, plasma membrane-type n=1 Tax=Rhododendron vialii TaxID=182163 RepID=UPI002660060F|nr:putative calcium-transporting ATPase 13, plasma membrane-type [Rhododendron vialii]XP_058202203.1 putative calcium-transporting ATPase 13, plasma membrane-type [Rhododendron vialii]XP_058202204.1 putative calcium-transporting ATPase 13, plasma membrane-type [Rhododendron vialii]
MVFQACFHDDMESSLLDIPSNPLSAKPCSQKRWSKALFTIKCSWAFSSPVQDSSDQVVIDVFEPHLHFPTIDQPALLTQIVKKKNLGQLIAQYNGVEGLASHLNTNLDGGIVGDDEDVSRRIQEFGSNTYPSPSAKNPFYFVFQALRDPTALVLLVIASLSLGFGIKENGLGEGWYDGGSIFAAVLPGIAVSAIRNFRKNRQLVKLSRAISKIQVDVVRSGRRQQVSIFNIVVGDVVYLKKGDQIPADGFFIDEHSLLVEESSITGESDPVEVDLPQNPFLLSGTKVADGGGRMLVTSVGMNTTWGENMNTIIMDSNEQTPLKSQLKRLTSLLEKVGLSVAFIVFVILLIQYFSGNTKDENGNTEYTGSKTKASNIINSVLAIIAAAVTIVDVAIPERLPLAVTLTLAYSRRQMRSDHAMIRIRKLSACETVGSATTICTDKTGMLTLNQMKVTEFWLGQDFVNENGSSSIASSVVELLHQSVGLNTTGWVCKTVSGSEFEVSGSLTEKAILSWAVLELKMDMEGLKQSCDILHVDAFNSMKKRSGVLMRKKGENTMNLHWKGAAEMVLAMCSNYYDVNGNIKVLGDVERKKFDGIIQGMVAKSLRWIAFAHKQVPEKVNEGEKTQMNIEEKSLTLLGIVGLNYPCPPGVKKAIEECQHAGVNVKMITGDNIFLAKAIATECGILKPNQDMESGAVVEGVEFRNYSPEERTEKIDKICVMASSSAFDKLLMVQCLKQKGHVVAVTGDGTNDAPALKKADIGLLMGKQGTEVAKESSDIVILDDNFVYVATVLRWGRCVYTNIQKFIQFQLTVNVAALIINFVAAISAGGVPLSALQLLWLNFIMDTLGALALATGKPTKELMEKPPVGRTKPLTTNVMWRNLLCQAFYQTAVMLILQFKGRAIFNVSADVNYTLMFNVFVLCQVFNEFNARKLEKKNVFEGIQKNKLFLGIVGVTIMLQVVMVEFLKTFADTERLSWWQWGLCVGFASVSWPLGWVVKWIPVPQKPFLLGEGVSLPELDLASTTNSGDKVPLLPQTSFSLMPSELDPASATNSGDEVHSSLIHLSL